MGRSISVRVGRSFSANGPVSHGRDINAANSGLNFNGISQGSLTVVSGPQTFAADGQLVQGKLFTGQVDVTGNNVTFRNCLSVGGGQNAIGYDVFGNAATFDGCGVVAAPGTSWYIGVQINDAAAGTLLTRCELTDCENNLTTYGPAGQAIECYIHDASTTGRPGTHPDNTEVYGGSFTFERCNLPMGPIKFDASINVAPFGARSVTGLDILDCAIDGGQGHILVDNQGSGVVHNVRVLRNDFGGHTNPDTDQSFGIYHPLTNEDGRLIVATQAQLDANPDAILWPVSGSDANYWRGCSDLVPDRTGQIVIAA